MHGKSFFWWTLHFLCIIITKKESGIMQNTILDKKEQENELKAAYEKFAEKRDKALSKTYSRGNGMCESEYKAVMNAGLEYARLRQKVMNQ